MRSKRVILIAAIALIAAGSVFGVAIWAARSDSRPFDDGVEVTEVAPVEDWALPEGATFVSARYDAQGTLGLLLDFNGTPALVIRPNVVDSKRIEAQLEFQLGTLQRSGEPAQPGSPWTPVTVRGDARMAWVFKDGFANRGRRTIVALGASDRATIHMWNAHANGYQEIDVQIKTATGLRDCLDFAERWRVPECDDAADLKAKWEAFVVRVGGK